MAKQTLYSTRTLSQSLLLCLLAVGLQVVEIQAWTVGQFSTTKPSLTKQSSGIGSLSSLKPPSTIKSWRPDSSYHRRSALFESTDDTTEVSESENLKRSAKRIRLEAEEMEMKLIQEKLEGLSKKLDKLDKKIAKSEPAEKEKNLKLLEEKLVLTRQIQMLEYRLNPDEKNDPMKKTMVQTKPMTSQDEKIETKNDEMVTMRVNLDNNSIQFVSVDNNKTETIVSDFNQDNMTDEEMIEKFTTQDVENIVFSVGDEGFDMGSMFNFTEERDCIWQSNETEYVGPLSQDDLRIIDELEENWQAVLDLKKATRNKKSPFEIAIKFGDDDKDEASETKEEVDMEVARTMQFAKTTFVEARAGNISKSELDIIRGFSKAVNFCQTNLPFLVEVAMNLLEGYKVNEEDPLYMERFNLFAEAYDSSLFSLQRNRQEEGIQKVFCEEVLDPNPKLFSRTAKPRQVGSAFLFDGKVVERDGDKVISGLKEALEQSSLKDKINIFYLRDPSPQIELDEVQQADYIQNNGGEDDIGRALELVNGFEPPALLITGKNLDSDKPIDTRLGITTFAFLDLVTTIGTFYYPDAQPNYVQEFVTGIQSPVLLYLLGTFALQHVIQLLLALKGGFKISPLPTLIPGLWGIPLVGSAVFINSPPKNKNDMFDFGFLAPFVGFLISYGFIVLGLESTMQVTNAADFAQMPHFELETLKQSFLTSATIESLMGTNTLLSLGDGASSSVPLDPMVIAGYLGLMINAIQMFPSMVDTNGGRAASAALGRFSIGYGGLAALSIFFLLVQSYRGGSPTLDFVALLYTFRFFFSPEMPCQNDVDNASSARLVALGISLLLVFLTLSPA
ncbi:unnamed protein product [Cylindrotheca closterium]|uniref:Uncharacterized protein n=1 Tax=Cylindrotheca closterium TaxID=2856 RepID=A0AAD2PU00_9STRA|nr:unnamed protein product [Cylindrotheca closterium]